MYEKLALATFSALSNATRLRMLKCLVNAGRPGMLAGEVAKAVGASPSRASFHLSSMAETGIIKSTRASRQIIYQVDFAAIGGVIRYLMQDCCQNNEIVLSCCSPDDECQ